MSTKSRFYFSSLEAKCAFILGLHAWIINQTKGTLLAGDGSALKQIITNRWTPRYNAFLVLYQDWFMAQHDADKRKAVEVAADDLISLGVDIVKSYDPLAKYTEAQAGTIYGPIIPISIPSKSPSGHTEPSHDILGFTLEAMGVPETFKVPFNVVPLNKTDKLFRTVEVSDPETGEVIGVYHTTKDYIVIHVPGHGGKEVEVRTWYESALGQAGQPSAPQRIRLLAGPSSPTPNTKKDSKDSDGDKKDA